MFRKLSDNVRATVDLNVVLMIGIAFVGLLVLGYIIWAIKDSLVPDDPSATTTGTYNNTWSSLTNVTAGFDDAVNFLLVAITIFILAIAIAALLMLRGRNA